MNLDEDQGWQKSVKFSMRNFYKTMIKNVMSHFHKTMIKKVITRNSSMDIKQSSL